jgi:hypothetical protein
MEFRNFGGGGSGFRGRCQFGRSIGKEGNLSERLDMWYAVVVSCLLGI